MYYYLSSFSFGAATNSHFHTVGNDSHLLSLNGLCVCLSAPVDEGRLGEESKGDTWVNCHTVGKLTNGPITHMVKVIIPSRYISVIGLFHVLTLEQKKGLPALLSDKCVTSLDSSTSSQQRATLPAGDCCSGISSVPPLTFLPPLAIDQNTSESGTKSMLPLLLIPWNCFPLLPIPDIHLYRKLTAGGFQGACVIRASPSLSPRHPYLIKNTMDSWLRV